MANTGQIFKPKFAGEKILHTRANISQSSSVIGGSKKNDGALVIDPNKLIDSAGTIADRYVKQEDLVTYCSLVVFKKPELTVEDSGSTRNVVQETPRIQINFLNPLKTNNPNAAPTYKGKYTTDWSDFFTSNSANDPTSLDYILDPETFGISDIDVAVNASQIPRITIRFIDVQGRTLFERGNDPNNPYNIFFTYPYPYFLLTYKGYYGKAVQFPLVLIKSNSRFDPHTGNYEITADFQAEIFSTLNTFLLMYAYAAPYMFPIVGGTYLGKRILERLYDRQNEAISSTLGADGELYQIRNAPTLLDLANAITSIPYNTLNNTNNATLTTETNDKLLQVRQDIETYSFGIIDYFNNNKNYKLSTDSSGVSIYRPINNNNVTSKNPVNLLDLFTGFNDAVKSFKSISSTSNTTALNTNKKINDTVDLIKSSIANNNQLKTDVGSYLGKFNIDTVVIPELFFYKGDPNTYRIDDFEIVQQIIQNNIDNVQIGVEDTYTNNKMKDIKSAIGYEPTMSNVLRIIANNMQTFMILLELVGMNAANQIKVNENRRLNHKRNTTYKSSVNSGVNFYTPFPNYNKEVDDVSNGTPIRRKVLAYPGEDSTNSDWFEINFVDEIYNATDRIRKLTIGAQEDTLLNPQKSGLSTIFPLGDFDLTAYENKTDMRDLLKELVLKYNMHSTMSGIYYRGIDIDSIKSAYSKTIADYEFDLMNDIVFSTIKNTAQQNILGNKLKKATSDLKTFAKTFAPNVSFNNIVTQSKKEINEYNKLLYTQDNLAAINNSKRNETGGYSLYYDIPQPENYSIMNAAGKAKTLGVYPDLTPNGAYIVQGTSNQLSGLAVATNKVTSQVNFFGGFMININKLLQENGSWNYEFGNRVEFANTTVPALTYNTTLSILNPNGELFTKVVKPQTNYNTIYKQF